MAGLGNPTANYANTRHNAGFAFVDKVASTRGLEFVQESRFCALTAKFTWCDHRILLLKPQTYMNRSGQAVGAVARYFGISPTRIVIAHDELDFPVGKVRLKVDGGHGGHNGLRDVISSLGAKEFTRVRIGIGHPGDRDQVLNYVLGRASKEEQRSIELGIERAVDILPDLVSGNIENATNRLHAQ